MDRVVISIGGSVLVPDENPEYIRELAKLLKDLTKEVEMIVVVGGGKPSRYYATMGRALGGTDYQLDDICITITRANAGLLAVALGNTAYNGIPTEVKDCVSHKTNDNIVVMGGTEPGHTTDAVSAMIAKEWKADRIVNASNVDAVYSDDPRKNPDAERFGKITIEKLKSVVYTDHQAAKSCVFDPLGVKIAMESKIDLFMINGRNFKELKNAILGKDIEGTFVDSH